MIKYTDEPGLFHVTLPDEITVIERKAFDGCDTVKTVTAMNVISIGRIWGDHEIKGARKDLCLVFPKFDIEHEPAYTFKMALCLGFLKYGNLYTETFSSYENFALVQKKWLLKSLINSNSDEMLLKALEFYKKYDVLSSVLLDEFLSFAIDNDKTLSCAVLINFKHSSFAEKEADIFDEFEL